MDNLNTALSLLQEQFEVGSLTWMILFSILALVALVYILRGIYIYFKRSVASINFIVLCTPIFTWAFLILGGPLLDFDNSDGTMLGAVIKSVGFFIPVLLMFHIWSQVSYRPITVAIRILWLILPAILTIASFMKIFKPDIEFVTVPIWDESISIVIVAANIFFVIVSIKAYLLCFNVFYQMPPHMRRSTYNMLIAISVIVVAQGVPAYLGAPQNLSDVLLAFACIIMMHTLFTSFFIANAANVIVTSREFVFASLSTLVITISLKGNILDWNRKAKDSCLPMPNPKFNEPYAHYKKRTLKTCNGTVSPHDENIISLKGEDSEDNFLLTWHEIGYKGNKFGYLVEIADITNIYSKLRYIESIAYFDNLTTLHNRNAYMERVKELDSPGNLPLLIIVGDVNNLKLINDAYGHLAGDKLLLAVTGAVKENTPEGAFVARIGGDEIVMLQPRAGAEQAEAFIAAVTRKLNTLSHPETGTPSVSWGYSVMRDALEDYNDVFRAADAIMYEEKRKAREVSISGIVPLKPQRHDPAGHGAAGQSAADYVAAEETEERVTARREAEEEG